MRKILRPKDLFEKDSEAQGFMWERFWDTGIYLSKILRTRDLRNSADFSIYIWINQYIISLERIRSRKFEKELGCICRWRLCRGNVGSVGILLKEKDSFLLEKQDSWTGKKSGKGAVSEYVYSIWFKADEINSYFHDVNLTNLKDLTGKHLTVLANIITKEIDRALDSRSQHLVFVYHCWSCRSVRQTSHSILPLPTQQCWVPDGTRKLQGNDWPIAAAEHANAEFFPEEVRL